MSACVLRLLIVLLLALLAVPASATAACHVAPVAQAQSDAHHAHRARDEGERRQAPTPHAAALLCVGCIPPGDWQPATIAPPIAPTIAAPVGVVATLALHGASAPALPPPRPRA